MTDQVLTARDLRAGAARLSRATAPLAEVIAVAGRPSVASTTWATGLVRGSADAAGPVSTLPLSRTALVSAGDRACVGTGAAGTTGHSTREAGCGARGGIHFARQ